MSKLDKLKADQTQRADTLAANAMSAEEQASSLVSPVKQMRQLPLDCASRGYAAC